jgi:hypothetical protein
MEVGTNVLFMTYWKDFEYVYDFLNKQIQLH